MNSHFFVWCILRQRNGGLNFGLKSATIVTDALAVDVSFSFLLYDYLDFLFHLNMNPQAIDLYSEVQRSAVVALWLITHLSLLCLYEI